MLFYWPKLLYPYYSLLLFFSFSSSCLLVGIVGKGKVFYGQEPPSGESPATECGFNYQLLAVIY